MSRIITYRDSEAGTPAVMRCDCGATLELWSTWAEECPKCHREYNGSGQLLADRSQWGEETGETFSARNWSNDEEGQ